MYMSFDQINRSIKITDGKVDHQKEAYEGEITDNDKDNFLKKHLWKCFSSEIY